MAYSRSAQLTVETRPPNDNFASRIPIVIPFTNGVTTNTVSTSVSGWNKNATTEPGEQPHQSFGPRLSVWWSFTPPTNGHVIAELTGANQLLAAYTGSAVNHLVPVLNLSNSLSRFEFLGSNNVEYLFAVDTTNGAYSQAIGLKLTFDPNYGAPIVEPGGGDGDFLGLGLGGSGAGDGCRDFSDFSVTASSLDGAVYYQWQFSPTRNGTYADLPGMTNGTLVLHNVTIANQGWYRAAVRNNGPDVAYSALMHLIISIGPAITSDGQPQSVRTNACTSARFKVLTESCSPMTYQWRQNGLNVTAPNAQGAGADTLIITNLAPFNEGFYDVVVWNANQSVTSTVATLTLTNVPTMTSPPQSVTKHACETPTFSVGASHNCALAYQWFFQGAPLAGATDRVLSITNAQPANAGDYLAVVSTPFASVTSLVAHLTVQTSPVILTNPIAPTGVRACDIVNLEVQAQAEPPCSWLAFQWQLGGTNVPDATNRVYSFEAQVETAGDYRVVVSNRWTSITSAVATVTVDARPFITTQPVPYQLIREGDSFTNRVGVYACGALTNGWQFKPLSGTNFSNVALDARHFQTSNTWLVVQNAQTNESGYYRVIVSNTYASVTSIVALVRVVRPPPNDYFTNAISLGSSNQGSATGYNEFATAEPGEPNHGLQIPSHSVWWVWTNPFPALVTVDLGGSDIDTLLGVYTGTSVSNLTIVAEDDNGGTNGRSRVSFMAGAKVLYFAVDGKNGAQGTNLVISLAATEIHSPPVITEEPVSLAASAGDTVTFTNRAYGSPDINIQWFGKGAPVNGNTTIVGLTNYLSTLTLKNITTNDQGVYYAVLSNSYGPVTTKKVTLTFGSIVRGMVTDATKTDSNGAAVGISNVLVSVGSVSTRTDQDGNYELVGVQIGDMRANFMANKTYVQLNEPVQFWNDSTLTASLLTATCAGYFDYVDDQFEVGQGRTVAKRFSMSPIFGGLRFVMNWTNTPGDLDLYLHFPPSVPVSYPWIDYLKVNQGNCCVPPFAIRDADMTQGWGPETISIHQFYPGTYGLYARKYPGQAGYLTLSAAQVVAYLGGYVTNGLSTQILPYGSVHVPNSGTNDWWHVCDIDGTTTNITWINQLMTNAPGGLTSDLAAAQPIDWGLSPKDQPPLAKGLFPTNVDYEWNFGDGTPVSTQTEPVHAYADPGWKTVSLKITQRIGTPPKSNFLTKTNYIYVLNVPPVVSITNPAPDTIFRAGDPITLQSMTSGVDDPIQQVDYYLVGSQTNYLGTTTNVPYTLVFPNANFLDSTNVFMALARDMHGASTWSQPVSVRIVDLRGDIVIIRNFSSPEVDEMLGDFSGMAFIPDKDQFGNYSLRSPVVRVLDQEGLYFGLVRSFKLIIWNDQGATDGGLTDNDVRVLKQAYDSGIPLYIIGEKLAQSRDFLTDTQCYYDWTDLTGIRYLGSIPGPLVINGIQTTDPDGLYSGWYRGAVAHTSLPYNGPLEWLALTSTNMEVVADVPSPGGTNSPLMLRYPRYTQPDFGQTRRLIQDFRVISDQGSQSADDRKILLVNGAAWLLRMFECPDLVSPGLDCGSSPAFGIVGTQMTFVTIVGQNSSCTPGGILVSNQLSPRLQLLSAGIEPLWSGVPPNSYGVTLSGNTAVGHFAEMWPNVGYQFVTVAVPRVGGWLTNFYSVTRGLIAGTPCSQVAYIEGPACTAVRLIAAVGTNHVPRVLVSGGVGCAFQLQSSTDLRNWVDLIQIQPDSDPYSVPIGPASGWVQFYRLRKLE